MTLYDVKEMVLDMIKTIRAVKSVVQFEPQLLEIKIKQAVDMISKVRDHISNLPIQLAMDWDDELHDDIITLEAIIDNRL
jgi:hypothetical protein